MDSSLAEVAQGGVRGVRSAGVTAFRGIPYAAAPVGPLRFRAPEPAMAWEGIRDCAEFGATVPKSPAPPVLSDWIPEPIINGDEYLNLNVWTPDVRAPGLPVLVWVHGGAFTTGSSAVPLYDGSTFARDGIVTVSLNYRVGFEGFGHLPDTVDNRGLLDQVAALTWVRDNIAAFGGDPDRVTIAGESAGGMSVVTLMAMPAARGLFNRVIAQSGGGHHALRPATAAAVTAALAERLGVEPTIAGFSTVDPDTLVAAQDALGRDVAATGPDPERWGEIAGDMMITEPVIDGDTLPALPYEVIAAGDAADVDLLAGSNDDEYTMFLFPFLDAIGEADVRAFLGRLGAAPDAYEVISKHTTGSRPGDVAVAARTDWYFRLPALRLAEAREAAGSPTYMYQFGWRTPILGGILGACHALDLPFVFDVLDRPTTNAFVGDMPPQHLADAMHSAWVDFVRDGDPGWPAYGAQRLTRRFDGSSTVEIAADPDPERREIWTGRR